MPDPPLTVNEIDPTFGEKQDVLPIVALTEIAPSALVLEIIDFSSAFERESLTNIISDGTPGFSFKDTLSWEKNEPTWELPNVSIFKRSKTKITEKRLSNLNEEYLVKKRDDFTVRIFLINVKYDLKNSITWYLIIRKIVQIHFDIVVIS